MPKDGWREVTQPMCPVCGEQLRGPEPDEEVWASGEYPYSELTGAFSTKMCHVYLTWRKSDQTWRWEIKDNIYWHYRGDDGKIVRPADVQERGSDLRQGNRGPDTGVDREGTGMHSISKPCSLAQKGRLSLKYNSI